MSHLMISFLLMYILSDIDFVYNTYTFIVLMLSSFLMSYLVISLLLMMYTFSVYDTSAISSLLLLHLVISSTSISSW